MSGLRDAFSSVGREEEEAGGVYWCGMMVMLLLWSDTTTAVSDVVVMTVCDGDRVVRTNWKGVRQVHHDRTFSFEACVGSVLDPN